MGTPRADVSSDSRHERRVVGIPLARSAIDERIKLSTSPSLIVELKEVLARTKFAKVLAKQDTSSDRLVDRYAALCDWAHPVAVPRVVPDDVDDDQVIACALAAEANFIVSGDSHLLDLKAYRGIEIIKPAEAWRRIESKKV